MKWLPSATKPRLSKVLLAAAVLAGAKLALLVFMGFSSPQAPRRVPEPLAQQPAPVTAAAPAAVPAAAPAPLAAVRSSILEDGHALAAQQASPAQDKKTPAQQPPAGSVLTIEQLKSRAEDLERKEQALKTLEADLNARMTKLQNLETLLKGMLAEAKTIKDEKMRHLIDVYTNMKSKQAASVLETLDENIAVKILAGMKGRQAGEILTFVSSKKAAKLSEDLTKLQTGPDLPAKP